jgi:hypothetical protein
MNNETTVTAKNTNGHVCMFCAAMPGEPCQNAAGKVLKVVHKERAQAVEGWDNMDKPALVIADRREWSNKHAQTACQRILAGDLDGAKVSAGYAKEGVDYIARITAALAAKGYSL